jgi:hypothetical protein
LKNDFSNSHQEANRTGIPLGLLFYLLGQSQRSEPMHIIDNSIVTSLFLFERVLDFGCSPLISFEYGLGLFQRLCIKHKNVPSS